MYVFITVRLFQGVMHLFPIHVPVFVTLSAVTCPLSISEFTLALQSHASVLQYVQVTDFLLRLFHKHIRPNGYCSIDEVDTCPRSVPILLLLLTTHQYEMLYCV